MKIRDMLVPVAEDVHLEVRRIQHPTPEGPTLVFLHESLGSIGLWRKFPEKLAAATGFDALIYNRLGYGRSSDEPLPRPYDFQIKAGSVWLPRLLDELGLDEVILVGHSDGGSIVLIAAGAMGARVKAMITMAAHVYADHLTEEGIRDMAVRYKDSDIRDRLHRHHGERTDDIFYAWQTVWLDEGFQQSLDFSDSLAAIDCPSLIIQGEEDEYGLPDQVTRIVDGIGASALPVFMPETGHSPHLEKMDQVIELIYDFLLSREGEKIAISH